MKKRVLVLISSLLAAGVITAFATDGAIVRTVSNVVESVLAPQSAETATETQPSENAVQTYQPMKIEPVSAAVQKGSQEAIESGSDMEMHVIKERMRAGGAYYDEVKGALEKYVTVTREYSSSDNEKAVLLNLSGKGYDFEKVLEVYNFIKLTDLDINALEELYLLSEKSQSDSSIENAFAIYTNRTETELSVADVSHYIEQGISVEEILAAYELTLTGDKRIKDVLDARLNDENIGEVIAESYRMETNCFGEKANLRSVLAVRTLSRKMNVPMNEVAKVNPKGNLVADENIMQKYIEKQQKIVSERKNIGSFENLDELIAQDIRAEVDSISEKEAQQLVQNGYTIREINQVTADELYRDSDNNLHISQNR